MSGFSPEEACGGSTTIKDGGTPVGQRAAVNFIEGANVTINVSDDPTNNEVDVTISASVTGASGVDISEEGGSALPVTSIDFVGSMTTASAVGAAGTITTAHGAQAGGTTHADVVAAGASGFMTGADKTKLNGIATGATNGITTQDEGAGGGVNQTTLNFVGAGVTAASVGAVTTVTVAGGASVPDGDKGDVTVSSSGTVWTVDNSAITYAKIQGMAARTLLGRSANSSGVAGEIVAAAEGQVVRRLSNVIDFGSMNLASSAAVGTSILGIANGGTGNTSGTATVNANLTGPVTSVGNATTITDAAVTLAKMANLAQDQFIGRTTASTGVPETATITAAARTVLDDTTVGAMVDTLGGAASSGTGGLARVTSPTFTTPNIGTATGNITGNAATVTTNANLTGIVTSTGNATAIANGAIALAKLANGTDGEIPTWDSSGVITTVAVGTSGHVLTSNGAGAAPTFQAPAGGGVSDGDKGDITISGTGTVYTIDAAAVTLAKMANLAQDQFIGRVTASTGVPETATITAAARTVLDDTTVGAMVNTLGGASSSGTGGLARVTSPVFTTPNIGSATGNISGNAATVTTNANLTGPVTSVGNATTITNDAVTTAKILDANVTLAKMANLAQDQFIGRVTASTGVPETTTITAAARTVLDDTTTAAMLTTLGGLGGTLTATDNIMLRTDGTGTKTAQGSGVTLDDANGIAGHTEVQNIQTGTTYTMVAADSGKVVIFTNGSAVTVTIPNTLTPGWHCRWEQRGAGKVSFNGTAVSAATMNVRSSGHVASAGQYGVGGLACYTGTGSNAVVTLFGDTGT